MEDKEKVGFHKGALSTLTKEYQELSRLVGITQQLIEAHMKALKDLGVDIEKEVKDAAQETTKLDDALKE
tara:strand:- start:22 stop:231 length:210 start_codon:yes stop_codon:yes gene_type:complete